jgi:hypothetical protein
VCNADRAVGAVGITAISARGVSGDVTLAHIQFQATGGEGDASPLVLSAEPFAGPSARPIEITLQHGKINIRASREHHLYLPLNLHSHPTYHSDYTQHR